MLPTPIVTSLQTQGCPGHDSLKKKYNTLRSIFLKLLSLLPQLLSKNGKKLSCYIIDSVFLFSHLLIFPLIISILCLPQMWKSIVGHDVSVSVETQGDDWDTDPDFVVSLEIALLG